MEILSFQSPEAKEILEKGYVLALPTETVYGLGVIWDSKEAYERLCQAKNRRPDKPIAVMTGKNFDLSIYFEISPQAKKVMDHFLHPRNVGVIEDANAIGEVGNAKCGDIMKMYLKIKDDIVEDVKFETFGCGSAIASSSMATEMIKGKPLSEVKNLTNKAVTEALDGLPAHKIHCSVLAEEAIHSALEDYERRQKGEA